MPWVLEWYVHGARRRLPLPWPRGSVYLGRPTSWNEIIGLPVEVRKINGVYVIPIDPPGEPVYTYIDDDLHAPVISRHHVMITIDKEEVIVMDHGRDGKGSTNWTIVNGVPLRRGESIRVRGEAVVKLGRMGPEFVLRMEAPQAKETTKEIVIVSPGVPTIVGESVARELESRNALAEARRVSGGRRVVVSSFVGELSIEGRGASIRVEPSRDKDRAIADSLIDALRTAISSAQSRASPGEVIGLLDVSVYKEWLERVDPDAARELRTIVRLVREYMVSPEDTIGMMRSLLRRVERIRDVMEREGKSTS